MVMFLRLVMLRPRHSVVLLLLCQATYQCIRILLLHVMTLLSCLDAACKVTQHCWQGYRTLLVRLQNIAGRVTNHCLQGYRALLSSPWYLNLGQYYGDDWAQYYAVEPLAFKVRQHLLNRKVYAGRCGLWEALDWCPGGNICCFGACSDCLEHTDLHRAQ